MRLQGFRPLDRGEMSLLAAFSLVVVLAGTGLFLQSFTPTSVSQTAAGQASLIGPVPPSATSQQNQAALTNTSKQSSQQICTQKKQDALGKDNSGQLEQAYKTNTTEKNNCIAAVYSGTGLKTDVSSYTCVGETTTVKMDKSGQGTIISNPAKDVEMGICQTKFCDSTGTKCSPVQNVLGGNTIQQWAVDPNTFSNLNPDLQKGVLSMGPIDPSQQAQLQQAFQQSSVNADTLASAATACASNAYVGSTYANSCDVNANIANIAKANGAQCTDSSAGGGSYTCDASSLQKASDALSQQVKALGEAQSSLTPCSATVTSNCVSAPPATCPAGQSGTPCVPTQTAPPCTSNCGGGGGGGLGQNALGSFLSGMGRGLTAPPAAPVAPAAATPAQACSTDPNTYAQQQQQYQTALQQYNYQQQQYQYQQQLNSYYGSNSAAPTPPAAPQACNPSTQSQCSIQPQQPVAANCTGGTWQPVYSGNCIINWQCSNLGAQLSCQPQTADVGMSLAITYSCAQGTASGTGFTASGQSGTSTAIVAAPPAGTNTGTYALTCTNGAITSGAQCSVQISKPTIILVANPANISAGQTSLIGWVTSGMKTCLISSPTDATFTSQNQSNTSVNGTATTLAATSTTQYLLHCTTVSGGFKDASTTVMVQ